MIYVESLAPGTSWSAQNERTDISGNEPDDSDMIDVDEYSNSMGSKIVIPGQFITEDDQFMRGHGTFGQTLLDGDKSGTATYASVMGVLQRTNKLLSVAAFKSKYIARIGDLLVGRVVSLQSNQKRWKVDINGHQDASLMLSSISLPGGILRRKVDEDELAMRKFFNEGDLLVAEVQALHNDGSVSLHTRSVKNTKLKNGCFLSVPAHLVQRQKTHFHELPGNVDVVIGVNGYIWISKHRNDLKEVADFARTVLEERQQENLYADENEEIDRKTRRNIAVTANCVMAITSQGLVLNDTLLEAALSTFGLTHASSSLQSVPELMNESDMSVPSNQIKIVQNALSEVAAHSLAVQDAIRYT